MRMEAQTKALGISLLTLLIWFVAFYPEIFSMVAIWQRSETFAHGYIIYPISLWLIWRRRYELREASIKPALLPLVPLIGCCCVWLAGNVAGIQVLSQLAAVAWLPFALWSLFGHRMIQVIWFPLCYMIFAVPIGEELIPQLQIITADITVVMLDLSGIPVFREGLYITVPGGLFEVAVACSGIRYLIASIALGTLFAHLQFASLKRQITFIIVSAIVPIVANGIRAYLIVLIAYSSDMTLATGVDHLVYGWIFFGIVMFILFWTGSYWRQPQAEPKSSAKTTGKWITGFKRYATTTILIASLLVSYLYKYQLENRPPPQYALNNGELEKLFSTTSLSDWQPLFHNADDYFMGSTQVSGNQVEAYIALYNDNRQDKELINFNHHLFNNEAWTPEHHKTIKANDGSSFGKVYLTAKDGRKLTLIYWYQLNGEISGSKSKVKLVQAWQKLTSQPSTGAVVILAAPSSDTSMPSELREIQAKLSYIAPLWAPQ